MSNKAIKIGMSATFTCLTAVAPSPKTFIYKGGLNVNPGGVPGKQISADEVRSSVSKKQLLFNSYSTFYSTHFIFVTVSWAFVVYRAGGCILGHHLFK